jgi:hypothetical protein
VSELNDPELDELEGRLSRAFAGTRPRRGFEDELWARLERRGSAGRRWPWRRLAPWPAAGALAAVLVIGLVAVLALPQLTAGHPASGSPKTQTDSGVQQPARGQAGTAGAARPNQLPEAAAGSFGQLPSPTLAGDPGSPGTATSSGAPVPYFGPARLTVTAQLPATPDTLSVYRYPQPTAADMDAFAARLGASRAGVAGTPTVYRSADFRLDLAPASALVEPRFTVSGIAGGATGSDAQAVAEQFLSAHGLTPSWPAGAHSADGSEGRTVLYQRQFPIAGASPAGEVDEFGAAAGLDVLVASGAVTRVRGPLPLSLESSAYRSRGSQQAARDAVTAPPGAGNGGSGVPQVVLNRAVLAYMAVGDGDHGYYLPVYLFSGTFSSGGVTMEKRVVVPALDASQLR